MALEINYYLIYNSFPDKNFGVVLMNLIEIFLLAIRLSMDAFAVAEF